MTYPNKEATQNFTNLDGFPFRRSINFVFI